MVDFMRNPHAKRINETMKKYKNISLCITRRKLTPKEKVEIKSLQDYAALLREKR